MAAEAGLTEEEYWQQITDACFLDEEDPIGPLARGRRRRSREYVDRLNALQIERLHVVGEDVDLRITLGERRQLGGGQRPQHSRASRSSRAPTGAGPRAGSRSTSRSTATATSSAVFASSSSSGRVVKASAEENEAVITEMVATENADKVGEFSLTDRRFSRITKFMAETLYDENVGGPFGNTHIALGRSYHDCYDGDPAAVAPEEWVRLGFNESTVHTDIVSTTDRVVTATLRGGGELVIYADGEFRL